MQDCKHYFGYDRICKNCKIKLSIVKCNYCNNSICNNVPHHCNQSVCSHVNGIYEGYRDIGGMEEHVANWCLSCEKDIMYSR